jgi:hypothetical protein
MASKKKGLGHVLQTVRLNRGYYHVGGSFNYFMQIQIYDKRPPSYPPID